MPSPAASRNSCAYGSLISGSALLVSAARPPATPSAVAPTLSLMSHVSSSVLAIGIPSPILVKEAERTSPCCDTWSGVDFGGGKWDACGIAPPTQHFEHGV